MGQQQLLLLVLATVIVGLATVAGIQAFEQGQTRANQDALTSTAVKIASDVQARIKEPSQFGGYDGDSSAATGDITLQELGYQTSSNKYEAADGTCGFSKGGGNNPMSADNTDNDTGVIAITCKSDDNEVTANVSSLEPDGITSNAAVLGSTSGSTN